jgi:hypothetical protein
MQDDKKRIDGAKSKYYSLCKEAEASHSNIERAVSEHE